MVGNQNSNKTPILELKGVHAGYNGKVVVEDVNLAICPGDFIGMIGPNGGGKTTLLKIILGLMTPIKGRIVYSFAKHKHTRNHIGYLPQLTLFDHKFPITVEDVVLGGLVAQRGLFHSFSKQDRDKVANVMEQMNVRYLRNRPAGELSGGQLQRTFLARALVSSPEILLLDEPDTFVDAAFAGSFYELLKEINRDVAIVLVTHDLGMISSYVKTIACVSGRLHYHHSGELTQEVLDEYNCPIELITHGKVPHRVLKQHDSPESGQGGRDD